MKRLFMISFVLLIAGGMIFAASITLHEPNGGEKLNKGSSFVITWTANGTTNPFKVTLWEVGGAQAIGTIKEKSAGDGVKNVNWTVGQLDNGTFVSYGKKYLVKVKEKTTAVADISEAPFEIKAKYQVGVSYEPIVVAAKLKGEIAITSPVKNGSHEINKPMTISWNKNLGTYTKVNIYLCTETNNQGEKIFHEYSNNGSVQWTPLAGKISWPGNMPYIKISTPDNFYSGKSGLFQIVPPAVTPPPPPAKNKVIARAPSVLNEKTSSYSDSGEPDCLSMGMYKPGRDPKTKELKVGHWKRKTKGVKCGWAIREYYFTSKLDFDISPAASKEIVRAELLITLGELQQLYPYGEYGGETGTNAYCNSSCRVFAGNTFLKSFSIFEEGKSVKIDLLNSVKNWSAMNQALPYSITFKGPNDNVPVNRSVCLKYYSSLILFVEYKE